MIEEITARNFKQKEINQKLTGRDIFVGKNGSGKTARVQAAKIALFGYIPEVGKKPSSTMTYSLADKMECEVKSKDLTVNRTFKRSYPKKGGVTYSSTLEVLPLTTRNKEDVVRDHFGITTDIVDIGQFIEMSAGQRKEFIANICANHVEQKNVKETLKSIYAEFQWNDDIPNIDNLNLIEETLKLELSQNRADLKAQETIKKDLMSKLEVDISESPEDFQKKIDLVDNQISGLTKSQAESKGKAEALQALRYQEKSIEEKISKANKALDTMRSEKDILKDKLEVDKKIDSLTDKLKKIKSKIEEKDKIVSESRDLYTTTAAEIQQLEKIRGNFEDTSCPFIGKECPESKLLDKFLKSSKTDLSKKKKDLVDIESSGKKLKSELTAIVEMEADMKRELIGTEESIHKFESEMVKMKEDLPFLKSTLKKSETELNGVIKKITKLDVKDAEKVDKTIEGLKSQRCELLKSKEDAQRQKDSIVTAEKTNVAIIELEESSKKINTILEFVGKDGLKGDIIRSSHKPLVEKMSELLSPMGLDAEVVVDAEDRNAFDICLKVDGVSVKIEALSDGEKIILSSAFLCALQDLSSEVKCKVLMIEASELDDDNFTALLKALDIVGKNIDNILIARIDFLPETPASWEVYTL